MYTPTPDIERKKKNLDKKKDSLITTFEKKIKPALQKKAPAKRALQEAKRLVRELSTAVSEIKALSAALDAEIEKLAEAAKPTAEERVTSNAFIHNTREGVIVSDTNGDIVFANEAAVAMLGYPSIDSLVGKGYLAVFKLEDEYGAPITEYGRSFQRVIATDKKMSVTMADNYHCVRLDKTRFPIMMTLSPVTTEDGQAGVMTLFHEVKKRSDRTRTDFISIASHQLRTPLTVATLHVDMLLTGHAGTLQKEQREYLEEIAYYNQKMAQILNEFLTVSRIERGTFVIEPKPVNVTKIAQDVVRELSPAAAYKNITLQQKYEKNLPIVVTDQEFLRISIHNLLSNAIKYTPSEGKVVVAMKKKASDLEIKVVDTGYGIPEDEQTKVFSKLFRGKEAKIHDPNGMGFGLYIVRTLLERCGGKISFLSQVGKGTTFTVSVPVNIRTKYKHFRSDKANQ